MQLSFFCCVIETQYKNPRCIRGQQVSHSMTGFSKLEHCSQSAFSRSGYCYVTVRSAARAVGGAGVQALGGRVRSSAPDDHR